MVFSDEVQLLLFAPANLEVELLADVVPVTIMRAVEVAADYKYRLLHRLDSHLAILLAVRVENLDIDCMTTDLRWNRILPISVNTTPLVVKLLAPVSAKPFVNSLRRTDRLKLRDPLIALGLDFGMDLVTELLAQVPLHAVRP